MKVQVKNIRFTTVVACIALAAVCGGWAALEAEEASPRVVAVGDVHCSLEGLTGILAEADLIDAAGRWIGGEATLVQVGDLLDRGLQCREVMDLLMGLQRQAAKAGGEVVCLLGNHEGMNLFGLVRDVNPKMYAAFVDKRSQKRISRAWAQHVDSLKERAELFGTEVVPPSEEERRQWLKRHPPGLFEYQETLAPNGLHGKWLRSNPAIFVAADSLFVHAGLSPALGTVDVDSVNLRVTAELRAFDRYRALLAKKDLLLPSASVSEVQALVREIVEAAPLAEGKRGRKGLQGLAMELDGATTLGGWYVVHPDGPLWFRGAALWDEVERGGEIDAVLDALGVRRMVVGHTVLAAGTMTSRFGGRVLAIDTGMLSEFYQGGGASALEILGDEVTAIYRRGERFRLVDGEWQQTEDSEPEE